MDRSELARALLGQGMLGQNADKMKLYPVWQEEYEKAQNVGEEHPQFEDWFKEITQHANRFKFSGSKKT